MKYPDPYKKVTVPRTKENMLIPQSKNTLDLVSEKEYLTLHTTALGEEGLAFVLVPLSVSFSSFSLETYTVEINTITPLM